MSITLVQHSSATAQFTSGTSGTISPTFGANTTAGNCIVACFTVIDTIGLDSVSVTTNGAAENWAQALTNGAVFIWTNPGTGGGQTVIDINITFGSTASTSNSVVALADIYEVSGLVTSSVVDQTSSAAFSSPGTSWNSGTTSSTTTASEIWFGCADAYYSTANTTETMTGPSSPWNNETTLSTALQSGGTGSGSKFYVYQLSGYQIVSSTGTATYSGTQSLSWYWYAGVATLKGAPPAAPISVFARQAVKRAAFY